MKLFTVKQYLHIIILPIMPIVILGLKLHSDRMSIKDTHINYQG